MTRALLVCLLVIGFAVGAPAASPPAVEQISQDELDALLAPIALYPDGLLIQVLIASTYPLELVQADRFLKQNSALRGEALDDALAKKKWDPSVQSLSAYPRVIEMMSEKIEWTERLGNAFLDDEGRVMDTVQSLRRRAEAAGNLKSNSEQTVVHDKETIIVEPCAVRRRVRPRLRFNRHLRRCVGGGVLLLLSRLLRLRLVQRERLVHVVLHRSSPLELGARRLARSPRRFGRPQQPLLERPGTHAAGAGKRMAARAAA